VSQPGRHRDEAIAAYYAVLCVWTEHHAELEALRLRLFPDAAPIAAAPLPSSSPAARDASAASASEPQIPLQIANLAKRLWPFERPPKDAREAAWLLDMWRSATLTDSTFFYVRPEVAKTSSGWVLRGATNLPRLRNAMGNLLLAAGCAPLDNQVEVLPATARLGEKLYGVVQIPMAMLWGAPREGDNVQTQLLLGERLYLLDESADKAFFLVHGGDAYVGWVRREAVSRLSAERFAEWESARCATLIRDVLIDDFRLLAGASLPIRAENGATTATLRLPRGVRATGGRAQCDVAAANLRIPTGVSAGRLAALAAAEFRGVPYVFGGRSRIGLDCSGLTNVAYAAAGLTLPRDARQQILVGQLVATPWHLTGLEPGDLLFFIDESGRVIHTGVSLGGMRFLHESPPEVHVSSLDPADPAYSKTWHDAFVFARRPMP